MSDETNDGDVLLPEGTFITTPWLDKKIDRGEAKIVDESIPCRGVGPLASVPTAAKMLGQVAIELLASAPEASQAVIVKRFNYSLGTLLEAYERLALAHHRILALAGGGSDPVGTLLNVAEASRQALLLPFLDPAIVAHLENLRPAPSKPARRTMRYVGRP